MMLIGAIIIGVLALIWIALMLEEILWMGIHFFGWLLHQYYKCQSLYWTLMLWYYKQRGDYAQEEDHGGDAYTGISDANGQATSSSIGDEYATEEVWDASPATGR